MALIDLNSDRYYKVLLKGDGEDVVTARIYETKEIREREKELSSFKIFVENKIEEMTNAKSESINSALIERGFYKESLSDEEQVAFLEEMYEDPMEALNSVLEEDSSLKELWDEFEILSEEGFNISSFFEINYEEKELDSVGYMYLSIEEELKQFDIHSEEDFIENLKDCSPYRFEIEVFVPDVPSSLESAYKHIQKGKYILSNFEDDI